MNRPALLAALLLATVPARAAAEARPPRIALLEVRAAGDLSGAIEARIGSALVAELRSRAVDVVPAEAVAAALSPLGPSLAGSCRAGQCVRWIVEVLEADAGLIALINAVETSYSVDLSLLGPDGDELDRVAWRCDICTFEELERSVAGGVERLELAVPRRLRAGRLGVVPTPADARVAVDGVELGAGALSVPVAEGRHRVEVSRPGYLPASRLVEVEPEQTTRVELRLARGVPSAPAPTARPPRPEPWLWTALSAGAAVAVSGGVLLGLSGTCLETTPEGLCASSWDEDPLGAGMLAAGLAAVVVSGVTLLVLSLGRRERSARPQGLVAASR